MQMTKAEAKNKVLHDKGERGSPYRSSKYRPVRRQPADSQNIIKELSLYGKWEQWEKKRRHRRLN